MRILFVSTHLPIPANNGQAIRSLSIIRALASSGHEVTFLSFAGKSRSKTLHPISSYCHEIDLLERDLTNFSRQSDYLGRIRSLLRREAYSLERFRCKSMRLRVEEHLRATPFDLLVCDSLYSLLNVPQTEIPIALNCHNVEHLIFQRYSRMEKNLVRRCYAGVEAHLLRDAEQHGCRRATVAMVCSNYDRDVLHRLNPDLPIFVIPNAVDTDLYCPRADIARSNKVLTLLFQGGMDWFPNRDAVEFFAETILPLVRAECPEVKFVVAGRNPPARLVEKLSESHGVEFTGTVPDMRPYLSAATVVVVPLRFGSGTRIKILEACAAGRPVVSTDIGAEGLELENGKDIIIADNPDEFARAVIALLRDPERGEAIGRSARSLIVERYSPAVLKNSLDGVVSNFRKQNPLVESIQ
jgi:glycosyltransferase involved in cell wall biosynthesis